MANSSRYAEAKKAARSPAGLNIDIKLRNRAVGSLILRFNKPRTHSREQIADGIREIEFTNPLLRPEPVCVAERGGERR